MNWVLIAVVLAVSVMSVWGVRRAIGNMDDDSPPQSPDKLG